MSFLHISARAISRATAHASRLQTRASPQTTRLTFPRPFHTSPLRARADKKDDLMDKDSMQPQPTEYAKSGSDEGSAHTDAAFDPNTTSPEAELNEAEAGQEGKSSLNVSPANKGTSQTRDPQEGGADGSKAETSEQEKGRARSSGKGKAD